jgi:hypothetical protein
MFHVFHHTPSCLYLTRFIPYYLLMADAPRSTVCLSHYFILPMYAMVSLGGRERKQKGNGRFTAVKIPHAKYLRNICFISGEDLS